MILPEYLSTIFQAEIPSGGWPKSFHIVTAHNPGKLLSDVENSMVDEELRKELNLIGSRCFRITGCSQDLKHREPGWGVAGLSDEEAVQIGRKYGQNAIFKIDEKSLFVIGCLSANRQEVGSWEERIL
jgi:hypothetical protein